MARAFSTLASRSRPPAFPGEADYLAIIRQFPKYGLRGWRADADGERGYFGDGGHGENGIRTNTNFFFVSAFLAAGDAAGLSAEESQRWLTIALQSLNYLIAGHVSGGGVCADGHAWGDEWQSAWWTSKLAHGAELIRDKLNEQQLAGVEKILAFEADRHCDRIVPSGLFYDTKAEENAWDAEVLAAATAFLPQHPHRETWRQKLIEFSFNTLSTPLDRHDASVVDDRVVRDAVYTCNLHADFSIENHGSLHFCYVASPLLSVTWSSFAFLRAGEPPPQALLHHVQDLWESVKPTFLDNRFAYVGGKDWARYTYGLYFILPVLALFRSIFSDKDARLIERLRANTLFAEHELNGDGSFFGARVTQDRFFGQSAKYETDCYAMCVLALLVHTELQTDKTATPVEEFRQKSLKLHCSPESRIAYASLPAYFGSFSWSTVSEDWPLALFIPRGCDDMAEWAESNLLGRLRFFGDASALGIRSARSFEEDGKLVIEGVAVYRARGRSLFEHWIRVEMTEGWMLVEALARTKSGMRVKACEPICLNIANDLFNDFSRTYRFEGGEQVVTFDPARRGRFSDSLPGFIGKSWRKAKSLLGLDARYSKFSSSWINVDDKLGLVRVFGQEDGLTLKMPEGRNTQAQCLHFDTLIGGGGRMLPRKLPANSVVFHERLVLVAADAARTRDLARDLDSHPELRKARFS